MVLAFLLTKSRKCINLILEEKIYVEQPEGFIAKGGENKVLRLKKGLYGLKQAPRA